MRKERSLQATTLRLILTASLFLILLLGGLGFSYWADILKDDATDVGKKQAEAITSQSDVQTLQRIQTELERNRDVITRASSIVAESQSYQYQNQIIEDITNYANRAGIGIADINFATVASSAPNSTPQQQTQPTAPAPSGVKTTSVSVTIKNPVDYTNLLRFIYSIEQNLTKMQISRVGLSREASGNVASDALTIEVYIR